MEDMTPAQFPTQLGQAAPTATEQALASLLTNVTTQVTKSATATSVATNRTCQAVVSSSGGFKSHLKSMHNLNA